MQTRTDQEILLDLMERTGLDERALATLLGVHQTTVWRLRKGRIAKRGRYIARLRGHLAARGEPSGSTSGATGMEYLAMVAKRSPHLRDALHALALFLQENA